MEKMVKCWEVFKCKKKECPVYKSKDLKCWLISGTHCRDEIQGKFLEKMEMCLDCEVFKANMDVDALRKTLKVTSNQFKEFRAIVKDRDKELEGIGLELAIGLSEVFDALKKISSGDPSVRISKASKVELITKLKHMVNITAENIGEIVYQSHEFAIGLAELFDVLHRVSKGDLKARVSGGSQEELLESLKKVTNKMIESISREITERKLAEEALREKEEREALILRSIPIAIYTARTSDDFGWIWVSEQIDRISGFPPDMHVKYPHFWVSRLHPDDRERVLEEFKEIPNKATIMTEYRWQCANGSYRWFRNRAVLIRDKNGKPKEIIGTWVDITDRREAEDVLRVQSLVDELTGLHNRRGFLNLAEQQSKLAIREKEGMLLFFTDLDGLKWINDNLGHKEGDRALTEIAEALKKTFRKSDVIARIGGDEFVVLATGTGEAAAKIITTRLLKNLSDYNTMENRSYKLSLSMGIAYYDPEHPCSISELMATADKLMYEQKQKKK